MSDEVPEPAVVRMAHPVPRRYVALGLVVVAIALIAALVAIRKENPLNNPPATETFTPASLSIMAPLTHIPAAILNGVPATPVDGPISNLTATPSTDVWRASTRRYASRPVVFFFSAEFAPYAAAERWPLIVALSRFGTFGPLGLMQSSGSTAFPGTSTFTFSKIVYSSRWVDLQTVERYSTLDPTGSGYTTLQTPDARQAAAVSVYDPSGTEFPFLDVANRYVLVGSGYSPALLSGQSQTQIVADLSIPTSPITEAIVSSANQITAAICAVTGDLPAKVCQGRGVAAADARLGILPPSGDAS